MQAIYELFGVGGIEQLDKSVGELLLMVLAPFTHLTFGIAAFFSLITLAFASTVFYYRSAYKATKALEQALACLDQCEDESAFTNRFTEIDQKLSDIPQIKQIWKEYVETLIPPLDNIDDPAYKVYRNTLRPQAFFTHKHVFRNVNPWINSETLIGLGLLLTFIGLVAALTESGNAFSGNTEEIKTALTKLLSVAGAKFLASVGGLGGSIVQGMFINMRHRRASETLERLNHKLEGCLQYASIERIAADQYGYAQRQTYQLTKLSNDIVMSLGERIDTAIGRLPQMLGKELTDALDPIKDILGDSAKNAENTQSEALGQMADEFLESLKGAGQQSMDQVVEQLAKLSEAMTGTIASLNTGSASMQSGLEQAVMSLEKAAQELQASLSGGASKAAESMETSGTAMAETLTAVLKDIKEQQSATSEALVKVVEKLNDASDTAGERMGEAIGVAATNTASAVKSATEGLTNTVTAEMATSISQMSDMLESAAGKVSGGLEQWANKTDQVSSSLVSMNNQLNVNKQGLQESANLVSQSSSAMREMTSSAKSSIEALTRVANTIAEASTAMQETTQESNTSVAELAELVSTTVEEGNEMLEALKDTWESQEQALSGADKELEQAFQSITKNLEGSLSRLSEFSQASSDKLSDVVTMLTTMVVDLQETVEDLETRSGR